MEYSSRSSTIGRLVDEIAERAPHTGWHGVRQLLDADETEEATDVIVAILVRDNVAVTRAERDRLRELMDAFELDSHDRSVYRYLGDPEMLDRMTVVDESS